MQNIKMPQEKNATSLHRQLNNNIGESFFGVSTKGYETKIHLTDTIVPDDIIIAQQILNEAETLILATSKTTIVANNFDEAIITCDALPADFNYVIYLNGVEDKSGSIADGSLELSIVEVGNYLVEIQQQNSYATGLIEINGIGA